jgi:hypothetical protein
MRPNIYIKGLDSTGLERYRWANLLGAKHCVALPIKRGMSRVKERWINTNEAPMLKRFILIEHKDRSSNGF